MNDVRVGQTRMCRINRRPYVIVDVDSAGEFGIDFRQSGRPGGVRFSAAELKDDEIVGAPEEEENVTQVIEPEVGQVRAQGVGTPYEILHIGNGRAFVRYEDGTEVARLLTSLRRDTLISPLPLPAGWEKRVSSGFVYRDLTADWMSICPLSENGNADTRSFPAVGLCLGDKIIHVPIADLRLILDRIEADLTNEEE